MECNKEINSNKVKNYNYGNDFYSILICIIISSFITFSIFNLRSIPIILILQLLTGFFLFCIVIRLLRLAIFIFFSIFLILSFSPILSSIFIYYSIIDFSYFFIAFVLSVSFAKFCYKANYDFKILISILASCTILFLLTSDFYQYSELTYYLSVFSVSIITLLLSPKRKFVFERFNFLLALFGITSAILFSIIITSNNDVKKIGLLESEWCNTKTEYDYDYSMKATYSYSIMKELLKRKYDFLWIEDYKGIEKKLNNLDVLLMLTPVKPFSVKNINAIEAFVSNGGNLSVIADHTDLYGHAEVLNKLLSMFGVLINKDSIFDSKDFFLEVPFQNLNWSLVRMKTPCSISIFRPSYIWAYATNSISEQVDYSRPNFFGNLEWTSDDKKGNWPIALTIKYHKGVINIFTDSTIFANFAIFQPSNLKVLNALIEGNKINSNIFYYIFFLLIVLFINFFSPMEIKSGIDIIGCFLFFIVILILMSDTFGNSEIDKYFNGPKIDVYADKEKIYEGQPNQLPDNFMTSTLYSNIARSGIYPHYIGKTIISPPKTKTLLISNYDDLIKIKPSIFNDRLYVIITDLIPDENIFFFRKKQVPYEYNRHLNELLNVKNNDRIFYEIEMKHSIEHNNFNVLASYGVYNDRFLGNWWINYDISPFKKIMLERFYKWLKVGKAIEVYNYPSIGISENNRKKRWKVKNTEGNEKTIEFNLNIKDNGFVYCGSGYWAIIDKDNIENKIYLLGAPELSDNLNNTGFTEWAATEEVSNIN